MLFLRLGCLNCLFNSSRHVVFLNIGQPFVCFSYRILLIKGLLLVNVSKFDSCHALMPILVLLLWFSLNAISFCYHNYIDKKENCYYSYWFTSIEIFRLILRQSCQNFIYWRKSNKFSRLDIDLSIRLILNNNSSFSASNLKYIEVYEYFYLHVIIYVHKQGFRRDKKAKFLGFFRFKIHS